MSESLETVIESEVYPEGSSCASGACPIPESEPVVIEEETLQKNDLVIFTRNKTIRLATVKSKGNKHLGLNVIGMQSDTKIAANTELIPVTVFVSKEVLELAGTSIGIVQ